MWKDHGTKILGAITTVLGALTAAPPVLAAIFGDYSPQVGGLLTALIGLGTAIRGFTNSATQESQK